MCVCVYVGNKVSYFVTFGRLLYISDVFINNGATVQCVILQQNCQHSCTVSCLVETQSEIVLTASNVL